MGIKPKSKFERKKKKKMTIAGPSRRNDTVPVDFKWPSAPLS